MTISEDEILLGESELRLMQGSLSLTRHVLGLTLAEVAPVIGRSVSWLSKVENLKLGIAPEELLVVFEALNRLAEEKGILSLG